MPPPPESHPDPATDEGYGPTSEILEEVSRLSAVLNGRDPARERRILRLRHLAGIRQLREAAPGPSYPVPEDVTFEADTMPETTPEKLTPELLRAAILSNGCLAVRGVVDGDVARGLAEGIDRAFEDRIAQEAGHPPPDTLYEWFEPEAHYRQLEERPWIAEGGGMLAVDSPRLISEMLAAFDQVGLNDVISGYLGEAAAVSAQKCTLRKADPAVGGAWHQDGNFLGDVRALNVWLSLSRCGDLAPGLDLIPRRVEHLVQAGTDGAPFSYVIAPAKVQEAAGGTPVIRPIFEPGDILLFDDLFLHQTGSDPSMPNYRYAIESWFFGASGFPPDYAPLAA